jgi:hypothetical protein
LAIVITGMTLWSAGCCTIAALPEKWRAAAASALFLATRFALAAAL